ncbi:NXPE family member 3-like [Aulostomus maculatus]
MKNEAGKRSIFKDCLPKCSTIFILIVFILIFVQQNTDFLGFQHREDSTIIISSISTNLGQHNVRNSTIPAQKHSFCVLKPLSPGDAEEERLLLETIAWPETPSLKNGFFLEHTSHPIHSSFTILPGKGGAEWHLGDQLEVMINMYDFKGNPKTTGGDFLIARLHNFSLGAGVAGQVVDHLNGSYTAVFPLLWMGGAEVEVKLVHSSEAITVLRRLNQEQPDRISFQSMFRSGSISETTTCNICMRSTKRQLCNFTDLQAGEPWFCYKPKKLSCDTRISHSNKDFILKINPKEDKLFQSGINLKVSIKASGSASVNVLPKKKGQPEEKSTFEASGYYYQGLWQALDGTTIRQFHTSGTMNQCLEDKTVHLYGDSTIRQWFEYLTSVKHDLKEFDLHSLKQAGPFMALDFANNILLTFRCHGPPIRFHSVPIRELRYIANELDGLSGGENTVVVIGIWSHFSTFTTEVYIHRLQSIRRAVLRLLQRAPATRVILRTANLKALTLTDSLTKSDWYSFQQYRVLRAIFKGLNVHLIDAWEMTLAHHLPHNLHPQPPIIKNMIDVLLSFICPRKGG